MHIASKRQRQSLYVRRGEHGRRAKGATRPCGNSAKQAPRTINGTARQQTLEAGLPELIELGLPDGGAGVGGHAQVPARAHRGRAHLGAVG